MNFTKNRLFKGINSKKGVPPKWKEFDLDLVKHNVLLHLYTPLGSRIMFPEFGTTIWQKLFEPYADSLLQEIKEEVERVIASEPRLQLINVDVASFDNQHGIRVSIRCNYVPQNIEDTFFADFVLSQNQLLQTSEKQI